ncbi:MAG: ParA family protein [Caulobacteraceae bacterium]
MRTIAIVSQKGGAGKTTLAVNLAAEAARSSVSLIVDTDPQATASRWGQWRGRRGPGSRRLRGAEPPGGKARQGRRTRRRPRRDRYAAACRRDGAPGRTPRRSAPHSMQAQSV